ncbi:MAG TPA: nuclear transport factor 2 family protein [Acidimicrobiales bacterium]|jgi:uncharacterized protein (TIGR02246 family)|nr:nuclear transport factor 2 family protein [Acidimicrobiales bacterium]
MDPGDLADTRAIERLLIDYADALDARDFPRVAACFTPGARATYSGKELEPGVDSIIELVRGLERFAATTHQVGNIRVDLDGDRATATSAAVAWLVSADDPPVLLARGLRYEDRLVRTESGWRIDVRVHRARWMWRGTAELPTEPDAVERALREERPT